MAKQSMRRSVRKSNKARTVARSGIKGFFGRLLCKRSVIIISDHKTQHLPFSSGFQALLGLAVTGFVVWASFSSGSYLAAQKIIDEKEQKLAGFAQENARVVAEFSLLKQDLMKLADGGKAAANPQAVKEIAAQYSAANPVSMPLTADAELASKYNVVFNRIQLLENKVRDLQSNHDTMMADIRATTGGKIKELERVIARTGVNSGLLQRAAEAKREQEEQRRERYGRIEGHAPAADGQGGPFTPAGSSLLQEKETELYFNLRKLVTLHDVVTSLPLDLPLAKDDYRQSSGFGRRVDPFRGVLGFHAGVDLAAPHGARVVASNDGRIGFAGWKTAYGNMIDVKHEYGFTTRYGHLSKILVRPGQVVKKGQVIGIQGSTGRSTGDHLHYEVRYNDRAINPGNFLKAGEYVKTID
ncbi:MAG: M23 family metallopeptidase [Alphaproteobacteria bacterium]|nr:M23 family metallopeptidase [Alphaproteobacteria bacterium]